jgi:chromosome segregation ATPase
VADESAQTGARPSEPDPTSGARPGGPQQPADSATQTPGSSTEGARPDTSLSEGGREALDRERNARRDADRQLAEARSKITELEDAGKSEDQKREGRLQRAQLELEQAQRRISTLESEAQERDLRDIRREVAAEAGLPASVAQRLQGSDLRTLRADAKKLAEDLDAGTPAGSVGIGRGGAAAGQRGRVDMNSLIREAAGRS